MTEVSPAPVTPDGPPVPCSTPTVPVPAPVPDNVGMVPPDEEELPNLPPDEGMLPPDEEELPPEDP